jgi:perosamine synthetase
MWVRKRIDIGWPDLAWGLLACCRPQDGRAIQRQIEERWSQAGDVLACLSVRSGFDLLLGALQLPPHSEVLITALTIPDMVRVIKAHDLVPVPLDLDSSTMAPLAEQLDRAVTPSTKVILVAHLFGGRTPLEPIIEFAKSRNLLVIEDCAQAYDAGEYRGHVEADASMFSFGTIKTATALGGAMIRVRNPEVLKCMRERQESYPWQSRWLYMRRLMKYAALKTVSTRPMIELVISGCRLTGRDYDRLLNSAVRGFPGPALMQQIRKQPSPPLLALLRRQLAGYNTKRLAKRTSNGRLLLDLLHDRVKCPGENCLGHTFWVFPVMVDDPRQFMSALREAGFDATQGASMCAVPPPSNKPELEARLAADMLGRIVFLPNYPDMPERAVRKMAAAVLSAAGDRRANRPRKPRGRMIRRMAQAVRRARAGSAKTLIK